MKTAKGILLVALGASSYGVLATFVKIANNHHAHTGLLTFAQFVVGVVVLTGLCWFRNAKPQPNSKPTSAYPRLKLMAFGLSLGFTSTFYYISIQYIPVSVGVILLMQAIWMGIVLEGLRMQRMVDTSKIIGGVTVIAGTLLATDVFRANLHINGYGLLFGLLAAISYTTTMYASNNVAVELPALSRSKYMVWGGLVAILGYWNISIWHYFSWADFAEWGIFLAVFGTVLPPIFFMQGFPITGTALGSIVAALEIPISVFSAYILLGEKIVLIQWIGIAIILLSVIIINARIKNVWQGDIDLTPQE